MSLTCFFCSICSVAIKVCAVVRCDKRVPDRFLHIQRSDYVRAPETKGTTILLLHCALKLLAFHLIYHAAMARGCPALCTLLVVLGACGAFSGSFVTGWSFHQSLFPCPLLRRYREPRISFWDRSLREEGSPS